MSNNNNSYNEQQLTWLARQTQVGEQEVDNNGSNSDHTKRQQWQQQQQQQQSMIIKINTIEHDWGEQSK